MSTALSSSADGQGQFFWKAAPCWNVFAYQVMKLQLKVEHCTDDFIINDFALQKE